MDPELKKALDTLAKQQADHSVKQEKHHKSTRKSLDDMKDTVTDLSTNQTVFAETTGLHLKHIREEQKKEIKAREKQTDFLHTRLSKHKEDPDAHAEMWLKHSPRLSPAGGNPAIRTTGTGPREPINNRDRQQNQNGSKMNWKIWGTIIGGVALVFAGIAIAVAKMVHDYLVGN